MRKEKIRAAVISDTHGLLRPETEKILDTCDVIIHAGDIDNQMLYHQMKSRWPLYVVRGNNDGLWAAGIPECLKFTLSGVSICMVHDKKDVPKDLAGVQMVIFGHSHQYYQNQEEGRLWLNPGSCGPRRFTLPLSLAVVTFDNGECQVEGIWLDRELERQEKKTDKKDGPVMSERQKESLFLISKILRYRKRDMDVAWTAENLSVPPELVEKIFSLYDENPQITAQQAAEKSSRYGMDG